jgi:hypothetical protein
MKKLLKIFVVTILSVSNQSFGQAESKWSYDLGFSFFKSSVNNQPDELLFNPVFEKWESINHQKDVYSVSDYKALDPYPFNLSIGFDLLFRYKRYFMIKMGYCYTNTLGIGGKGNITYTDIPNNLEIYESKKMSYYSHQLNYFIGPLLPINDKGAEIYMGFSMMSPTYISYNEQYKRYEAGTIVQDYNKTFNGFFGNCRTVIGIQVPVTERFKFGSEIVFAYFNGIELKSGDLTDEGFKFPNMQWNFTFRYKIK